MARLLEAARRRSIAPAVGASALLLLRLIKFVRRRRVSAPAFGTSALLLPRLIKLAERRGGADAAATGALVLLLPPLLPVALARRRRSPTAWRRGANEAALGASLL